MDKGNIIKILGITEADLIEFEEDEKKLKVFYKFNEMYHVLNTEDITDVNEGHSFSSPNYSEVEEEYNSL